MGIEIALSPGLNVSPEAFAAAWNADPQRQAVGQAKVRQQGGTQFEPLTLVAFIAGVGGGVTSSVISHFLIKALDSRTAGQAIEIQEVTQPNGDRVLVVKPATD